MRPAKLWTRFDFRLHAGWLKSSAQSPGASMYAIALWRMGFEAHIPSRVSAAQGVVL